MVPDGRTDGRKHRRLQNYIPQTSSRDKNGFKPHSGFGCCPFCGGGSVVNSLFIVAPIAC